MDDVIETVSLFFQKFSTTLWKNCMLLWRNKCLVLSEIFYPALLMLILLLLRAARGVIRPDEPISFYERRSLISFPQTEHEEDVKWKVAYSPEASPIKGLMEDMITISEEYPNDEEPIPGVELELVEETFARAIEMTEYLTNPETQVMKEEVLAGIEFPDHYAAEEVLPEEIEFALRFPGELRTCPDDPQSHNWFTEVLNPSLPFSTMHDFNYSDPCIKGPKYYEEGFLLLQHLLSLAIIRKDMKSDPENLNQSYLTNVSVQHFSHPSTINDTSLDVLAEYISLIFLLALAYPVILFVQMLAKEKRRHQKEIMRVMGLSVWMYFVCWLLAKLTVLFVIVFVIVILIKTPWFTTRTIAVLTYSNPVVLFLFIFLYGISAYAFACMISSFCRTGDGTAGITLLIWFLFFVPFIYFRGLFSYMSLGAKCLLCLFNNTAMAYGFQVFIMYERLGAGVQWGNVNYVPLDNFTLGFVMLMLLVDSLLYMLIAMFVDEICCNIIGSNRLPYFCCLPKFWGCCHSKDHIHACPVQCVDSCVAQQLACLNASISYRAMYKYYCRNYYILNDINFDVIEQQITLFVGLNGTGKTTCMHLATGMKKPSSGAVYVNQYNARWSIMRARRGVGYAPQRIHLHNRLTVREHLYFYASTKTEMIRNDIPQDVDHFVEAFDLCEVRDHYCRKLSTDKKRRLMVAIAFVGNSKVILLDEPAFELIESCGRTVWKSIQCERLGRTILATSSNMKDVGYADRAALLEDHALFLLDSKTGRPRRTVSLIESDCSECYYLTLGRGRDCVEKRVTRVVKKYVPEIFLERSLGGQLSYRLDLSYKGRFECLLAALERCAKDLHLTSYQISTVCPPVRQAHTVCEGDPVDDDDFCEELEVAPKTRCCCDKYYQTKTGCCLCLYQFCALLMKRCILFCRGWKIRLIMLLLAILIIILLVVLGRLAAIPKSKLRNSPPRRLTRADYEQVYDVTNTPPGLNFDRPDLGMVSPLLHTFAQYHKLYYSVPKSLQLVNITTKDMDEFILEEYEYGSSGNPYLWGSTLNKTTSVIWDNHYIYHSLPLVLNLLHIAEYRSNKYRSGYSINVINKPLPFTEETMEFYRRPEFRHYYPVNEIAWPLTVALSFIMIVTTPFVIILYVRERISKMKLQQHLNGVGSGIYWFVSLLWDMLVYTIFALILVIIIKLLLHYMDFGPIMLVLFLFLFAVFPKIYLASFCFRCPHIAFTSVVAFNLFVGIGLVVLLYAIRVRNTAYDSFANFLENLFFVYPPFTLTSALARIFFYKLYFYKGKVLCLINHIEEEDCTPAYICSVYEPACVLTTDIYDWRLGIGKHILAFILVGIISLCLLYLYEYSRFRFLTKCWDACCGKKLMHRCDIDVPTERLTCAYKERQEILCLRCEEIELYAVVVRCLTKHYRKHLIIDNLCLRIPTGECVLFVGPEGVGKTTLIHLLIGEETITYGEAYLYGYDVKKESRQINKIIGYCPENDPYVDELTPRETLRIFCMMRGISYKDIPCVIDEIACDFCFEEDLDKRITNIADGSKRTISVAIALVGNPDILFLDEPTKGMDIKQKACFCRIIQKYQQKQRCVIITTKDSYDFECICTKIVVFKTRCDFEDISTDACKCRQPEPPEPPPGFVITIKVKDEVGCCNEKRRKRTKKCCQDETAACADPCTSAAVSKTEDVKEFITKLCTGAVIIQEDCLNISFGVPVPKQMSSRIPHHYAYAIRNIPGFNAKVSTIYAQLEANREALKIEHFSVLGYRNLPRESIYLIYEKQQGGPVVIERSDSKGHKPVAVQGQ